MALTLGAGDDSFEYPSFTTGGAASWIQTGDVWRSGAIDSSMEPDDDDCITSWLELTVDGPCTVSFASRLLPYEGNGYWTPPCQLWVDGEGKSWNPQPVSARKQSVDVCGGGLHVIRWEVYTYSYWGDGQRSPIEISNVELQDAPASVTVRFDANGGTVGVRERTFSTSADNYGELPVPTRGGCEFLGWFTAKLGGERVDEGSGVRFGATVLYAQWSIPLKQAVGAGQGVEFLVDDWHEPWDGWHGVLDESHDGTGAAFGGKNADSLEIQTSGKGTLSFWWKAKGGGFGYVQDNDWNELARIESTPKWSSVAQKNIFLDSDWQRVEIPIMRDDEVQHRIQSNYYVESGDDCGVFIDEVRWTPAPAEVTVSFDANGGRTDAQPMTFDTYGCYEGLPTPTRDGWNFDGWFSAPVGGWRADDGGEVLFYVTTLYAHWSIPLNEALGTDFEIVSGQMPNSDDFFWYGNPEVETPVGRGAACARKAGKKAGTGGLLATVEGMGTISFWWKTKGDANGQFTAGQNKNERASISVGVAVLNPETGAIEYLDSEWKQVTVDCHGPDEAYVVYWNENLHDESAELQVCGLTWTPAPESMEVKYMFGKDVVGKTETYRPGERFFGDEHELCEPTRAGYVFGGWFYDKEFDRPVQGADYVPFAGATVYAKWYRTLASAETPLRFVNNPDAAQDADLYRQIGYAPTDWELVERTYDTGTDEMAVQLGEVTDDTWNAPETWAVLETTVTGSAFLDFVWRMSYGNGGLGSLVLTVDGKEVEDLDVDWFAAESGASSEQTVRVVLGEGEHTVRWEASGYAGATAQVRDISASEITPAATLGEWMTRWRKLWCWTPDNLSALIAKSAAEKASGTTTARYKAAIEHALATVLSLGEDKLVVDTLGQFGYDFDFLHCKALGSFRYDKAPVLNKLADEAVGKMKTAVETALADLDAIPSTWTGAIPVSAAEYPVDADIVIDLGDVLYLKSLLKAALGAAQWVKAYDVEVDWEKLEADSRAEPIEVAAAEPKLGLDDNWGKVRPFTSASLNWQKFEDDFFLPPVDGQLTWGNVESSGDFQVAWSSNRLYLRVKKTKFFVEGKPRVTIDFGNGLMSGHLDRRMTIFYSDSGVELVDLKTGEKKTIYWYVAGNAVEDLPDIPAVDFQENESEFVLSVDLSGTEIAKNAELRRLESLDVSTYGTSETGGVAEVAEGVQRYLVKDAKSGLAAVGQAGVCGKVRDATALEQSKALVLEALKLAQSADAFISTKRTRPDVCLFNYADRDEALVAAMREHVATAIASMDSVQAFDWRKGLSEERQGRFPGLDSPIDVYLGALFSGRATCGVIPPSAREDVYVADLGRMSSPTLAGLMPGMTREKWAELAEAKGEAYRYEAQAAPTFGPWGESDAVKNPDKLAPTMLTDMTLTVNGLQAVLGDVVAAFRADTGALCGLGKVMDGSGALTMACYAPTGVKLHFQVWLSDSGVVNPNVLDCIAKSDLTVTTSGAFISGHALVVSDSKDLTISLRSADWHTVSFNVRPDDPSPAAVFADVKSKVAAVTQGVEFWMPGKTSSLTAIEIGKGYWVNTKADNVEWTVSGKTDPTVAIALEEGWNLVGYVPEAAGAVQQVLKTAFAAKAIDYVACGIELYPGGTLKTLEPGKAYWVHANGPYVLRYDEPRALMKAAAKAAAAPTFGPWGESDAVKNPDKLMPTVLEDVAVRVDGGSAAPGDVVAAFRADTGALCGLGKVLDDSGTLKLGCLAPKGTVLSFKVWLSESGMEKPVVARCDDASKLVAPESGAIFGGHVVSASTAVRVETIIVGARAEIDTDWPGCAASGLPAGLTYNKTTGKITGAAKAVTAEEGVIVRFTKSGAEPEEMTIVVRKEVMSVGCERLEYGTFTAGVASGFGSGVLLDEGAGITTESGVKSIAVNKLPKGMKFDAKTHLLTGWPTQAGSNRVEIVVTAKSGAVERKYVDLVVEALPAWAVGNFAGVVTCADGTHGTASLSVTDAGKISGKLLEHGSNWTFTASSFATASVARGLKQDYVIVADAKCGKSTRAVELHVTGCAVEDVAANAGLASGELDGVAEVEMWRNVWKDADAKGVITGIAGKYTYFFADDTALPLELKSSAALSGKAGIRARGNASVSFTTTVFASSNGVEAAFYVAPDAKKGYGEIYERFRLVPESGAREPSVARRAPGVVAVPEHYPNDEGYGTVTMSPASGQVDAGKTVTVTAKPDSKSVFVKWRYEVGGETKYSETSKLVLTMDGEHDVFASAIFRSKGSFKDPVVTVAASEQRKFEALELGVQFSAFVTVTEATDMKPVKWSASKLPTGLKINAETGEISGIATAVNSGPVTITATSVANPSKKATFTLDIGKGTGKPAALPETAVGTFTGFVDDRDGAGDHVGTFTFTSTEKGALSAKVVDAKGTVSFSGSGFMWSKEGEGKYEVALETKKGEKLSLTLDSGAGWDKDQLGGSYSSASGQTFEVRAQRNAFSKAWYFTAEGDEATSWTFAYTTDANAAALTVTLKADGTTSVSGKLGAYKVSASGVANAGMMREGALGADFAPVLTAGGKKKVLAIRTYLWFDRSNKHVGVEGEGVGEARFVE